MTKAVVFDMDGVIFDTERAVIEAWQEVIGDYGIQDIVPYCMDCLGATAVRCKELFFERFGDGLPYDEMRVRRKQIIRERFAKNEIDIKPGVEEMLKTLKEKGIKVALASSTNGDEVRAELAITGLIEYFDEIVTGDMVSNSKPAPDIFLKACEKLGVTPEESIGIEDSFNGIRSCHAAGLYTIMIPDLKQPDEEIRALADVVLPDMFEAMKLIETP